MRGPAQGNPARPKRREPSPARPVAAKTEVTNPRKSPQGERCSDGKFVFTMGSSVGAASHVNDLILPKILSLLLPRDNPLK